MNKLVAGIIVALSVLSIGCQRRIGDTYIEVEDSIRHYYPVRQGQELSIMYKIKNKGPEPLYISDIQPSCGCIILEQDAERAIPPGGSSYLHMRYNSTKNVGHVEHKVRLFGNIAPYKIAVLKFDVNVVPDADYTRDYEQLYKEYNMRNGIVEDFVGGKERDKGYYVDSTFESRRTRDKETYGRDRVESIIE